MGFGGFALREVPGSSDRFFYLSPSFTFCCSSLGRPQRSIYWRKCGFSLSGNLILNNLVGQKLNSLIKCTHIT